MLYLSTRDAKFIIDNYAFLYAKQQKKNDSCRCAVYAAAKRLSTEKGGKAF